jgi:hypothetical protein
MRVRAQQQNEKKYYLILTILNKNSKLRLSHRKFSYFFKKNKKSQPAAIVHQTTLGVR